MFLPTSVTSCRLRPWTPADKPDLVRHANNRHVWRNLTDSFPHPYTEADADDWIAIACKPGRDLHLAVEFAGQVAGGIGAIAGHGLACQTCQFGYWLGEAHWGRGLATAAVQAFVRHVEARRLFARLEARVFEWNPASMRVLEKAGFVREGLMRQSVTKDGQLIDSVMYACIVARTA
ncbi:MAG: GNAT family N-acetyltransferase [Burkholderiaceae bacterium]|nr:GNAT family N-acetyltransferase [Burkholderiaceae bacterium]